ncbi:hypothetical protein EVAR_85327_1 [Eumeta japonica]|uniref:Uncharacterized protein n=1 Tax=Eumeta variegata TaxID=151549 RepID=A0A4C1WV97_EUMVA|nr:hypothetical protein EVAR_85327_1 [Eumeta japonica]
MTDNGNLKCDVRKNISTQTTVGNGFSSKTYVKLSEKKRRVQRGAAAEHARAETAGKRLWDSSGLCAKSGESPAQDGRRSRLSRTEAVRGHAVYSVTPRDTAWCVYARGPTTLSNPTKNSFKALKYKSCEQCQKLYGINKPIADVSVLFMYVKVKQHRLYRYKIFRTAGAREQMLSKDAHNPRGITIALSTLG